VPAVLINGLEKFLVKFRVAVALFGINWHANGSLTEKCICLGAPLRCARAFGRVKEFFLKLFPRPYGLGSIILPLRGFCSFGLGVFSVPLMS
jgi:hypothetical protein